MKLVLGCGQLRACVSCVCMRFRGCFCMCVCLCLYRYLASKHLSGVRELYYYYYYFYVNISHCYEYYVNYY